MANPRLEQLGRMVTTEQLRTPRRLDRGFVPTVLLDKTEIFLFLFGLTGLLSGVLTLLTSSFLLYGLAAMATGGLLMSAPFIYVWQWWRALRYGRLGYAAVVEVMRGGQNRGSFAAIDHGTLIGTWQVDLGTETLELPFKLERPGMGKSSKGWRSSS
ncbi:MAG: hypothetical protein AAGF95_28330 [Chloroflexota bacterium]